MGGAQRECFIRASVTHRFWARPNRNPPGKPWRGERYDGQTLLIVSEQGYGDTIWASRYLARVKALGGELIVECRKAMMPLIESMGIADAVIRSHWRVGTI